MICLINSLCGLECWLSVWWSILKVCCRILGMCVMIFFVLWCFSVRFIKWCCVWRWVRCGCMVGLWSRLDVVLLWVGWLVGCWGRICGCCWCCVIVLLEWMVKWWDFLYWVDLWWNGSCWWLKVWSCWWRDEWFVWWYEDYVCVVMLFGKGCLWGCVEVVFIL